MNKVELNIGTAGWSYKDWIPSFYSQSQTKEFDWLTFYAQYFNSVEVNSTYYSYIKSDVVKSWVNKVAENKDFLFAIKLHQDFTHKRVFTKEQAAFFEYNLDILRKAERLGPVLMQFPYSFGFDSANVEYLSKLFNIFEGYSKCLEVRHNTWNNKEAVQFLQENDVSFCVVDQPKVGKSISFNTVVTNDTLYVRCHGRNVQGWTNSIKNFGNAQTYNEQNERYKYLYSPGELVEIERQIKEVYDNIKRVFLIMNNHPFGYAVANAFEFMYLLKDRNKVRIPDLTVKTFSRLEKIAAL